MAADLDLLDTLKGSVADGAWLNEATAATTNVVLGAVAADRFGIVAVDEGTQLYLDGEWFTIVGVLNEFPLSPDLDRAVFIGKSVASTVFEADLNPSVIYVRTTPEQIDAVRGVLPSTADPREPR